GARGRRRKLGGGHVRALERSGDAPRARRSGARAGTRSVRRGALLQCAHGHLPRRAVSAPASTIEQIPRRAVLGVPIALVDYTGAMDAMDGMIERREPGYVSAAAVHVVMLSRHDPETRAALRGASLVLPDGRPLVWALNLLGAGL